MGEAEIEKSGDVWLTLTVTVALWERPPPVPVIMIE